MDLILVPGDSGKRCPGNMEFCDECDYLICCTNYNGLCDKCRKDNGACQWENPPALGSPAGCPSAGG